MFIWREGDRNGIELRAFASEARRQALLIAKFDNLGNGASGAAVQNLMLMLGAIGHEGQAVIPPAPGRWAGPRKCGRCYRSLLQPSPRRSSRE